MLSHRQVEDLNRFARELREIEAGVSASDFQRPLNRTEQKEITKRTVARGGIHEPVFIYPDIDPSYALARWRALRPPEAGWLGEECALEIGLAIEEIEAAAIHDPASIAEASIARYGLPSDHALATATDVLSRVGEVRPRDVEESHCTAEVVREMLVDALRLLDLPQWRVQLEDNMAAQMSVSAPERIMRIRKAQSFTESQVRRLLVHEVGTHVFRGENGSRQPTAILGVGLTDYASTEEGLAVLHEEQAGLMGAGDLRRYALRLLAVDLAHRGSSFAEVLEYCLGHTGFDEAFDIAVRVKRGFTNTHEPGAHVKDLIYLSGYLEIKAELAEEADLDQLLMVGKVALRRKGEIKQAILDDFLLPPKLCTEAVIGLLDRISFGRAS